MQGTKKLKKIFATRSHSRIMHGFCFARFFFRLTGLMPPDRTITSWRGQGASLPVWSYLLTPDNALALFSFHTQVSAVPDLQAWHKGLHRLSIFSRANLTRISFPPTHLYLLQLQLRQARTNPCPCANSRDLATEKGSVHGKVTFIDLSIKTLVLPRSWKGRSIHNIFCVTWLYTHICKHQHSV